MITVSLLTAVGYFILGSLLGWVTPRVPFHLIPRLSKRLGGDFTPYPKFLPVEPRLLSRLLNLRRLYYSTNIFLLFPALFGLILVKTTQSPLGFGLLLGSGWALLTRLVPNENGRIPNPYSMQMIMKLAEFISTPPECCSHPSPCWGVRAIWCNKCGHKLHTLPRPDIGRRRNDGWLVGGLRSILLDGSPPYLEEDTD